MNGALALDEINPWHFRAPLAPLLAARREHKKIELRQVLAYVRAMQKRFDLLIVEGAGGLLSPLGGNAVKFSSRDLISALRATPIVVAPNQLGVVNQVLLTLEALPKNFRSRAKTVLMASWKRDLSPATNGKLLAEFFPAERVYSFPWLNAKRNFQFPGMTRIIGALLRE